MGLRCTRLAAEVLPPHNLDLRAIGKAVVSCGTRSLAARNHPAVLANRDDLAFARFCEHPESFQRTEDIQQLESWKKHRRDGRTVRHRSVDHLVPPQLLAFLARDTRLAQDFLGMLPQRRWTAPEFRRRLAE